MDSKIQYFKKTKEEWRKAADNYKKITGVELQNPLVLQRYKDDGEVDKSADPEEIKRVAELTEKLSTHTSAVGANLEAYQRVLQLAGLDTETVKKMVEDQGKWLGSAEMLNKKEDVIGFIQNKTADAREVATAYKALKTAVAGQVSAEGVPVEKQAAEIERRYAEEIGKLQSGERDKKVQSLKDAPVGRSYSLTPGSSDLLRDQAERQYTNQQISEMQKLKGSELKGYTSWDPKAILAAADEVRRQSSMIVKDAPAQSDAKEEDVLAALKNAIAGNIVARGFPAPHQESAIEELYRAELIKAGFSAADGKVGGTLPEGAIGKILAKTEEIRNETAEIYKPERTAAVARAALGAASESFAATRNLLAKESGNVASAARGFDKNSKGYANAAGYGREMYLKEEALRGAAEISGAATFSPFADPSLRTIFNRQNGEEKKNNSAYTNPNTEEKQYGVVALNMMEGNDIPAREDGVPTVLLLSEQSQLDSIRLSQQDGKTTITFLDKNGEPERTVTAPKDVVLAWKDKDGVRTSNDDIRVSTIEATKLIEKKSELDRTFAKEAGDALSKMGTSVADSFDAATQLISAGAKALVANAAKPEQGAGR